MRITRMGLLLPLVLTAALAGTGCQLFPEVEERVVDLALRGSTSAEFQTFGEIDVHDERDSLDIREAIDIEGALEEAGVDVSDVQSVQFAGAAYRVLQTEPDTPTREIQDGVVAIQRGLSGTEASLIANFNVAVNDPLYANWQTAVVQAPGVTLINGLLADLLAELQGGPPASNTLVIVHTSGVSSPIGDPTDFRYEIRLDVSIVGTVKVDVLD
jgi:hypothetical protein